MKYQIKLMNKIAPEGTGVFPAANYDVSEDIAQPDGIMVRSASLHEMNFEDNLLAIARAGAGVNNIPVELCSKKGIVVFNSPGANANAVKELTIAALFLASRDISGGIAWAKSLAGDSECAKLVEKGKSRFEGPEIQGKTLGVVGLGAIGVMVANVAHDLGMDVYGYDPYLSVDAAWHLSRKIRRADSIDEICAVSDYITIHVPLNPATKGSFNADLFAKMKDGVRILNLARGEIVNYDDLGAALLSGKIAKYVTDFPSPEVLDMTNTVAIPHLGASTPESEVNCALMAARELKDYIEYGVIKNSVNLPNVEPLPDCAVRICIIHENVPNMISHITSILGGEKVNIEHLTNQSKKDMAYTVIDTDSAVPDGLVDKIAAVEGVIRVRTIKSK
ncbi:MAG: phosphoglycerate dehydrogenase [Clostridia bacterium]|nr:phosphoglycerate dehydrogenase [Clostridia bacterium]